MMTTKTGWGLCRCLLRIVRSRRWAYERILIVGSAYTAGAFVYMITDGA